VDYICERFSFCCTLSTAGNMSTHDGKRRAFLKGPMPPAQGHNSRSWELTEDFSGLQATVLNQDGVQGVTDRTGRLCMNESSKRVRYEVRIRIARVLQWLISLIAQ
jgi:hypothetical protein